MEVDRDGLEVLDRDECLRLLATATLGRIGFTSRALPTVLPVNFRLEGERILVCTARGSTLDAALRNVVVAFEVDDFDPMQGAGWSVAVTGVATEIANPIERDAFRQEPGSHWASAADRALISISTELVSGRRTPTGEPAMRR